MRSFIAASRQLLFLMKTIFFLLKQIHLILTDLQMKLLQNLSGLVLPVIHGISSQSCRRSETWQVLNHRYFHTFLGILQQLPTLSPCVAEVFYSKSSYSPPYLKIRVSLQVFHNLKQPWVVDLNFIGIHSQCVKARSRQQMSQIRDSSEWRYMRRKSSFSLQFC